MAPRYCCVVNCHSHEGSKDQNYVMHRFPGRDYEKERRQRWIALIRTASANDQWEPTKNSRICSKHFVNGTKSNHPSSPSFNPSIFPSVYKNKPCNWAQQQERYDRTRKREASKVALCSSEIADVQSASDLETNEPQSHLEVPPKKSKDLPVDTTMTATKYEPKQLHGQDITTGKINFPPLVNDLTEILHNLVNGSVNITFYDKNNRSVWLIEGPKKNPVVILEYDVGPENIVVMQDEDDSGKTLYMENDRQQSKNDESINYVPKDVQKLTCKTEWTNSKPLFTSDHLPVLQPHFLQDNAIPIGKTFVDDQNSFAADKVSVVKIKIEDGGLSEFKICPTSDPTYILGLPLGLHIQESAFNAADEHFVIENDTSTQDTLKETTNVSKTATKRKESPIVVDHLKQESVKELKIAVKSVQQSGFMKPASCNSKATTLQQQKLQNQPIVVNCVSQVKPEVTAVHRLHDSQNKTPGADSFQICKAPAESEVHKKKRCKQNAKYEVNFQCCVCKRLFKKPSCLNQHNVRYPRTCPRCEGLSRDKDCKSFYQAFSSEIKHFSPEIEMGDVKTLPKSQTPEDKVDEVKTLSKCQTHDDVKTLPKSETPEEQFMQESPICADSTDDKPYECPKCKKKFLTPDILEEHSWTHKWRIYRVE